LNRPHPPLPDFYHRLAARGWLGVTLFFVVSGYCIAASADREAGWRRFAWRRAWRIFPPYWASLVLVLAVIAGHLALRHVNDVAALPRGVAGLALTFAALVRPASPVAGLTWVYWSIPVELAFYAVMGLTIVLRPRRKLLLLVLGLLACVAGSPRLALPVFPSSWLCFSLGVSVYCFATGDRRFAVLLAGVVALGLACSALTVAMFLVAGLTAAAILAFLYGPRSSPPWQILRWLGTISYSLYLTHVPIGCYVLDSFFGRYFPRAAAAGLLRDGIFLVVCVGFAALFYRWVEKPAHAMGRRGFGRPAGGPAVSGPLVPRPDIS
jgi:peptidoglycan/LPS O-acetylase OafA/YrhL